MVSTTLEIYKYNVPFGIPVLVKGQWTVAAQTEIKAEPLAGYILLVSKVSFVMSDDFELSGASAYLRIEHSAADGTNEYYRADFDTTLSLLAASENHAMFDHPASTPMIAGSLPFHPPVQARSVSSEYFSIIEEGALVVAGTIDLVINGWQMLETEFDEVP